MLVSGPLCQRPGGLARPAGRRSARRADLRPPPGREVRQGRLCPPRCTCPVWDRCSMRQFRPALSVSPAAMQPSDPVAFEPIVLNL